MTIRLMPERRGFVQSDFESLKLHYDEQILQIHVMAEYVQRVLEAMADALRWRWTTSVCAVADFSAPVAAQSRKRAAHGRPRRNRG